MATSPPSESERAVQAGAGAAPGTASGAPRPPGRPPSSSERRGADRSRGASGRSDIGGGARAVDRALAAAEATALPAVVRTLDLAVDLAEAWELVAHPAGLATWLGAEAALDARPGSDGSLVETDGTRRGLHVERVEAGRLLAFRWWVAEGAPGPESLVTFELAPTDAGTRLTVTERPVAPGARSGARACAWHDAADAAWDTRLLLLGVGAHLRARARGAALVSV